MSPAMLSLFLDITILIVLGITIYFALQLSARLKAFSRTRKEFHSILETLSASIEEAQRAVRSLKSTGLEAQENLGTLIDEARAAADEFAVLLKSGENMARRLDQPSKEGIKRSPSTDDFETALEILGGQKANTGMSSFSISDRDVSFEDTDEDDLPEWLRSIEDSEQGLSDFGSQAERDLYKALQKKKTKRT